MLSKTKKYVVGNWKMNCDISEARKLAFEITKNSKLKTKNLAILAFASDGRDNTEAAGAIGDFSTLKKAKKLKLEPEEFLDQNNSFNFFKKTGDLIFAKQKTFNVSDLMIILKQ